MCAASRMRGDVLLVGSMPFDDSETVFRQAANGLRGHLGCLPDGEVKERKNWVGMLPEYVFAYHPQLEEVVSPGAPLEQPNLPEGVHLQELDPFWAFRVKPGETLVFDNLKYADFAIDSYRTFTRLRSEGVIEAGTRFQVCLPSPNSGIDAFFSDINDWPAVHEAYQRGLDHEVARILEVVPADDLVIQFDMAWEVVDIAMGEANYFSYWPRSTEAEKFERHAAQLDNLWRAVPDETLLGYHWCYGTWGGWPMTDMRDLDLCVRLTNEAAKRTRRRLDYVHMPAVKDPGDGFFDPLDRLEIGDTKVYLGIVHEDEPDTGPFKRRLEAARRHLRDFGIGGVCGYGRVDPADLPKVLKMHADCAAELIRSNG